MLRMARRLFSSRSSPAGVDLQSSGAVVAVHVRTIMHAYVKTTTQVCTNTAREIRRLEQDRADNLEGRAPHVLQAGCAECHYYRELESVAPGTHL